MLIRPFSVKWQINDFCCDLPVTNLDLDLLSRLGIAAHDITEPDAGAAVGRLDAAGHHTDLTALLEDVVLLLFGTPLSTRIKPANFCFVPSVLSLSKASLPIKSFLKSMNDPNPASRGVRVSSRSLPYKKMSCLQAAVCPCRQGRRGEDLRRFPWSRPRPREPPRGQPTRRVHTPDLLCSRCARS